MQVKAGRKCGQLCLVEGVDGLARARSATNQVIYRDVGNLCQPYLWRSIICMIVDLDCGICNAFSQRYTYENVLYSQIPNPVLVVLGKLREFATLSKNEVGRFNWKRIMSDYRSVQEISEGGVEHFSPPLRPQRSKLSKSRAE